MKLMTIYISVFLFFAMVFFFGVMVETKSNPLAFFSLMIVVLCPLAIYCEWKAYFNWKRGM